MRKKPRHLLLALLLLLPVAAWAQLKRMPIQNVELRQSLETYKALLASRPEAINNAPGSGVKPFRRLEWYLAPRLLPDGGFPAGARWNAYLERLERGTPGKTAGLATANWTSIGPNNIAGRMLDLAFDPNHANVIWAGAAAGGIWRSADGGSSWTPMDDQLPTLSIGCVVTHPTNSNIIYIGTGEGSFNIDAVEGVGVLKSIDGGLTWSQTGLSWLLSQGKAVNEMVMDPTNFDILVAATSDGVYRTADGGTTWTRTLGASFSWWDVKDIVIDPSNHNILYVAIGLPWINSNNGIYKSTDNGVTWTKLTSGLPASTTLGRISLAISASSPNTVYAGIAKTIESGSSLLGIYRTTDGGGAWTLQATSPNHYNGQGWYNNVIAVDPTNANIVYSGGTNIYKSTNGGAAWSTITNGIHVDFHAIAFNAGVLYVGCDGGVYKSATGGSAWTSLNNGLTTMQFYKMGSDFNNANKAMGGTQDNGTNEYSGSLAWVERLGADGGEVVFDFSNSNIIYGEYQNGFHLKSINGGLSWFGINNGLPGGPWVTPVEMDPVDANVLYTIGSDNLYKTSNGGGNWSLLFNAAEFLDKDIQVAPSDNQTIYVCGEEVIYQSTNAGGSFAKISNGLVATRITAMAVHPAQPQTLYVANSGWSAASHVYKTVNGGAAWQNVTNNFPNVPCNTIVIDPANPNIIYAGSDLGVYVSTDEGATWNDWNDGLPNVVVDELDIQAARVIRAATHGRGMYAANMVNPAPAVPNPPSNLTAAAVCKAQIGFNKTEIDLAWTDNSPNEDGFAIERKTGAGGVFVVIDSVGAGAAAFSNSGLNANATYFYRVRAFNAGGNSAYSNAASAKTFLNAPSNLTATPVSGSQINLVWKDNTVNETGFKMERKIGATGTYAEIATIPLNVTSFSDNGMIAGPLYCYRLRAVNASNVSCYSNEGCATLISGPPPNAPSNLTATTASASQINLAWTDNSFDETGFIIKRSASAAGPFTPVAMVGANVQAFSNKGLAANTPYFYQVGATNAGNNSAPSNTANATTLNTNPDNLALNKTMTASSTDTTSAPARAVDGNVVSFWRSGAVNAANPVAWLYVDLGSAMTVGRAVVNWNQNYYAMQYEIQISNDAASWSVVHANDAGAAGRQEMSFTPASARYVRLYLKKNFKASYRVIELEVYAAGAVIAAGNEAADYHSVIPERIFLEQNYPNPFNPATTIRFGLPEGAPVTLKIFNVKGEEVATLMEGWRRAGSHAAAFDGSRLASGVYLYVLQAGETKLVRQFILMK